VEDVFLTRGFDIVNWSFSVRDWEGPAAESVANRILSQSVPGAIIALHDKTQWLIEILDVIVPQLKLDGFQFRKITESGKKGMIQFG